MQCGCQRAIGAIHVFSIVWRLPEVRTLLQGGKLARFGTRCVYKRIGGWEQTRHLCLPCFPGTLFLPLKNAPAIHLFRALTSSTPANHSADSPIEGRCSPPGIS